MSNLEHELGVESKSAVEGSYGVATTEVAFEFSFASKQVVADHERSPFNEDDFVNLFHLIYYDSMLPDHPRFQFLEEANHKVTVLFVAELIVAV